MTINPRQSSGTAAESVAFYQCLKNIAWYSHNARRDRRLYVALEVVMLLVSAGVTVSGAVSHDNTLPATFLGAVAVVLTGFRQLFRWQENYIRWTKATQDLTEQRNLYEIKARPYDNEDTRDQELMAAVHSIISKEMQGSHETGDKSGGKT